MQKKALAHHVTKPEDMQRGSKVTEKLTNKLGQKLSWGKKTGKGKKGKKGKKNRKGHGKGKGRKGAYCKKHPSNPYCKK